MAKLGVAVPSYLDFPEILPFTTDELAFEFGSLCGAALPFFGVSLAVRWARVSTIASIDSVCFRRETGTIYYIYNTLKSAGGWNVLSISPTSSVKGSDAKVFIYLIKSTLPWSALKRWKRSRGAWPIASYYSSSWSLKTIQSMTAWWLASPVNSHSFFIHTCMHVVATVQPVVYAYYP